MGLNNQISSPSKRIVVLTFVSNYLPGYKAGGILRTIANTVDHLSEYYDFWIVTRDRDLGDKTAYPDIKLDSWHPVGKSMIRYLPPESCSIKNIVTIINSTPYNVLYLNSFFDSVFTLKILLARKIGLLSLKFIILAPRGELISGPLSIKHTKKSVFIFLAKRLGFYKDLIWQASSEYEAKEFMRIMNIDLISIHIAPDLPAKQAFDIPESYQASPGHLKLIFLSRITREKNLHYALKVLQKVSSNISFDLYGPREDPAYWDECESLINSLPSNVKVNYMGIVRPPEVPATFSKYDLFFFPTSGENYGHVIAESLTAGTPVLISNKTPWNNLLKDGLGWDLQLDNIESFVKIIEYLSSESTGVRDQMRKKIKNVIKHKLLLPSTLEANKKLFMISEADDRIA